MADGEISFHNKNELRAWLNDKPPEWAQAIAARAALRTLPLLHTVLSYPAGELSFEQRQRLILAGFRANFIMWAALKYPSRLKRVAASAYADFAADAAAGFATAAHGANVSAANAATAFADATAACTTFVTASVNPSTAAAAFAANASSAAADAAAAASAAAYANAAAAAGVAADIYILRSVEADSIFLKAPELAEASPDVVARDLINLPLWGSVQIRVGGVGVYEATTDESSSGGPAFVEAIPPNWASEALQEMSADAKLINSGFEPWIIWYRKLLPYRQERPSSHLGKTLDIEIAMQPNEWWERDAAEVNADIAEWLEERHAADHAKRPPTIRQFIIDYLRRRRMPANVANIFAAFGEAGIDVVRKTMLGELSRLTTAGEITRVLRGVYVHNDYLADLEQIVSPAEPPAGPGPQYRPVDGKLSEVASLPVDDEVSRQQALHRRLKREAAKLREILARVVNRYPELANAADEFNELISADLAELDVTGIWSVGGSLASFGASYRAQNIERTLAEPLEPEIEAVLQNVVRQYGAFIMGFAEGRDLVSRADEFAVDTARLREIAEPGNELLSQLTDNTELVDERTRALHRPVRDAVFEFGWEASRNGYTAYLVVRNGLRAIIKFSVGEHPNLGSIAGLIAAGGVLVGDPNAEFIRAALPVLQNHSSQILAFFKHSPEMRAYVEWALQILEADSKDHVS